MPLLSITCTTNKYGIKMPHFETGAQSEPLKPIISRDLPFPLDDFLGLFDPEDLPVWPLHHHFGQVQGNELDLTRAVIKLVRKHAFYQNSYAAKGNSRHHCNRAKNSTENQNAQK